MSADLPQRTTVYKGPITDSTRWDAFTPRDDDIFIATFDKCGSTWTQAICAFLIFADPEIDVRPAVISPWFDAAGTPLAEVLATLEAQTHRRFIKTHTPLDGIAYFPQCTYLIVYRDPRDVFLSMRAHMANEKTDIFDALLADDINEGFRNWVATPHKEGERETFNLEALVNHFRTFKRFAHLPNLHLFHYADMKRDLKTEMTRMAAALRIDVSGPLMDALVRSAGFGNMSRKANQFAPGAGMESWKDETRFFNSGSTGQWCGVIAEDDLALYDARMRELLPEEDITWLERGNAAGLGAA